LKILGVPEDFVNPEKNPYFDENLAAAPRERRSRPLKFAQQGKYINIANQIRSDQRAQQLRREIEEAAKANVDEDDQQVKDGFTKVNIRICVCVKSNVRMTLFSGRQYDVNQLFTI
jgi:U4/U6 small nuclear ribonucleoprotein PRP3